MQQVTNSSSGRRPPGGAIALLGRWLNCARRASGLGWLAGAVPSYSQIKAWQGCFPVRASASGAAPLRWWQCPLQRDLNYGSQTLSLERDASMRWLPINFVMTDESRRAAGALLRRERYYGDTEGYYMI